MMVRRMSAGGLGLSSFKKGSRDGEAWQHIVELTQALVELLYAKLLCRGSWRKTGPGGDCEVESRGADEVGLQHVCSMSRWMCELFTFSVCVDISEMSGNLLYSLVCCTTVESVSCCCGSEHATDASGIVRLVCMK